MILVHKLLFFIFYKCTKSTDMKCLFLNFKFYTVSFISMNLLLNSEKFFSEELFCFPKICPVFRKAFFITIRIDFRKTK